MLYTQYIYTWLYLSIYISIYVWQHLHICNCSYFVDLIIWCICLIGFIQLCNRTLGHSSRVAAFQDAPLVNVWRKWCVVPGLWVRQWDMITRPFGVVIAAWDEIAGLETVQESGKLTVILDCLILQIFKFQSWRGVHKHSLAMFAFVGMRISRRHSSSKAERKQIPWRS